MKFYYIHILHSFRRERERATRNGETRNEEKRKRKKPLVIKISKKEIEGEQEARGKQNGKKARLCE